jgi:hypothetical protein
MGWWDWDIPQKIWKHSLNSAFALGSWKGLYWFGHLGSNDATVLWALDKIEDVVVLVVLLSLAVNLIIDVSPPNVKDWVRDKLRPHEIPANIILA